MAAEIPNRGEWVSLFQISSRLNSQLPFDRLKGRTDVGETPALPGRHLPTPYRSTGHAWDRFTPVSGHEEKLYGTSELSCDVST